MKIFKAISMFGLLLSATSHIHALEPLTAETLNEYCAEFRSDPFFTLSKKCVAYKGGFIDGAIVTDERVAENVANEFDDSETLAERAYRTRVSKTLRDYGPSVYANFCIGQPVPLAEIVLHVIEELEDRKTLEDVATLSVVYGALVEHYPSKKA